MANNKQYKQYTINNIVDACCVLSGMITQVILHLDKYIEYSFEATMLLNETSEGYVLAKKYEDIKDKLWFRQHELLKVIADMQSSSFSYNNLRKILEKKKFLKNPLDDEITKILKELLDIRNWTFHNPQSLVVASEEVAEKNIPDELKDFAILKPQLNPVIVTRVNAYSIQMLASLVLLAKSRGQMFNKVLLSMKKDYQDLYDSIENKPILLTGNEIKYIDRNIVREIGDYASDIAQVSMAIQKSKYDGSDEKFNEWVIRPSKDSKKESENKVDE